MKAITAQQALDILLPIAPEEWCIGDYENDTKTQRCAIGHLNYHLQGNPEGNSYSEDDGGAIRGKSKRFLRSVLPEEGSIDIADVNNDATWNGYTEPVIKDRVIHLLKDMVKAGY